MPKLNKGSVQIKVLELLREDKFKWYDYGEILKRYPEIGYNSLTRAIRKLVKSGELIADTYVVDYQIPTLTPVQYKKFRIAPKRL